MKEHDIILELQKIRKKIVNEDKFQKDLSEKMEAALVGPRLDEEGTKQLGADLRALLKSVDTNVFLAQQFNEISNDLGDLVEEPVGKPESQVH